jgi:dolichyl-phosphate-mannose-protein mannosyltransferase
VTDQLIAEPIGSRLDDWWGRLVNSPARARAWFWGGPLAVTLLAAILRLANLGNPHALVFDETFYVKDAWTLWNNGYETTWPANGDQEFVSGNSNAFMTDGSYVVPFLAPPTASAGGSALRSRASWPSG